jgi:hypothetical protein
MIIQFIMAKDAQLNWISKSWTLSPNLDLSWPPNHQIQPSILPHLLIQIQKNLNIMNHSLMFSEPMIGFRI